MTRHYEPDLQGIARMMEDEAAAAEDQFQFDTSQLLSAIAAWHEPDESNEHCRVCWDHGQQFSAHWPCDTHQNATTFALLWLMRRVS